LSLQDPVKLKALKARGVKRFSFGVQTFNERIRKKLGIRAKISDIFKAVEAIKEADFKDYSLDIMYNLPEQTMEDIANDLEMVERLNPIYVDAYNLNIFPNTKFKEVIDRGNYFSSKPNDENEITMFKEIMAVMKDKGYNQVMVNTFSKTRTKPVITLDMCLNGSRVLGIGPSARSYLSGYNYRNIPSLEEYAKKIQTGDFAVIAGNTATAEEQTERQMVFFPAYTYIKKSEVDNYERFAPEIQFLINHAYAEDNGSYIRLTDEGKIWPGNISALFFNEKQRRKSNISFLNAYKYKENPYNQDKMGISRKNKEKE
jgi:oxygen-independent coproporphyrinogen-3 oxidase